MLRKFEKNKSLLATVRARTVSNKHLILEHHGRLQTLKVNLETLRRKLVSPLVRRNDSVSIHDNNGKGAEGCWRRKLGVWREHMSISAGQGEAEGRLMELVLWEWTEEEWGKAYGGDGEWEWWWGIREGDRRTMND